MPPVAKPRKAEPELVSILKQFDADPKNAYLKLKEYATDPAKGGWNKVYPIYSGKSLRAFLSAEYDAETQEVLIKISMPAENVSAAEFAKLLLKPKNSNEMLGYKLQLWSKTDQLTCHINDDGENSFACQREVFERLEKDINTLKAIMSPKWALADWMKTTPRTREEIKATVENYVREFVTEAKKLGADSSKTMPVVIIRSGSEMKERLAFFNMRDETIHINEDDFISFSEAQRKQLVCHETLHYLTCFDYFIGWAGHFDPELVLSDIWMLRWLEEGATDLVTKTILGKMGVKGARISYPKETAVAQEIMNVVGEEIFYKGYFSRQRDSEDINFNIIASEFCKKKGLTSKEFYGIIGYRRTHVTLHIPDGSGAQPAEVLEKLRVLPNTEN